MSSCAEIESMHLLAELIMLSIIITCWYWIWKLEK